jgi:hypothetical protein
MDSTSIEQIRIEFVLRVIELLDVQDFLRNNFNIQKILLNLLVNLIKSDSDTFVWNRLMSHIKETIFGKDQVANSIMFHIDTDKLSNFFLLESKLLKNGNFQDIRRNIIRNSFNKSNPVPQNVHTKLADIKITRIDNAINSSFTSNESEDNQQVMDILESLISFQVIDSLMIRLIKSKGVILIFVIFRFFE